MVLYDSLVQIKKNLNISKYWIKIIGAGEGDSSHSVIKTVAEHLEIVDVQVWFQGLRSLCSLSG